MNDNEKIDPDYIKGFNEGYLLAQYRPELAKSLDQIEKSTHRLEGFGDGRKAYYLEIAKGKMLKLGEKTPKESSSLNKNKPFERDER